MPIFFILHIVFYKDVKDTLTIITMEKIFNKLKLIWKSKTQQEKRLANNYEIKLQDLIFNMERIIVLIF
jgi:hypothetical protein